MADAEILQSSVNKPEAEGRAVPSFQPAPAPSATSTLSMIEQAEAAARRIEEGNKRAEELLNKQEAIATRLLLGGRAEAGTPIKTAEQDAEEKSNKLVADILKKYR